MLDGDSDRLTGGQTRTVTARLARRWGGCYWDVLCQARNSDRLAGVLARRITDAGGDTVAKETGPLDADGQ